MNDYENEKRHEFRKQNQRFTIKVYGLIIGILGVGGIYALTANPMYSMKEKVFLLSLLLTYVILSAVALFFGYRVKKHFQLVDLLLLLVALAFYGLNVYASKNGKVVNFGIWFPVLLMFTLSTLRVLYPLILLSVHGVVIFIFYQWYPSYTFVVDIGTYMNLAIVIAVLGITTVKFLRLTNQFQENIFADMNELDQRNMELAALNEEYYAAQEELMDQYD